MARLRDRSHLQAVPSGGATNSRPSLISETAKGTTWKADSAGVDTLRVRFRAGADAYEGFKQTENTYEGPRGERWRKLGDDLGAARVGVYPDGLVYVEGRAAAIADADPDSHRLAARRDLSVVVDRLVPELERATLTEFDDVPAAVGRIDLAGELRFDDGADGVALLNALALADVPRAKTGTEGRKGDRLESVTWRAVNGRSILGRAYDKGVESRTDPRGERVRLERQIRVRKTREQLVSTVQDRDLEMELARFVGPMRDAGEVTVCTPAGALEQLERLVDEGHLTGSVAQRLAGFAILGGAGLSRASYFRTVAELRKTGIVIDRMGTRDVVVVPVPQYVAAIGDAWPQAA